MPDHAPERMLCGLEVHQVAAAELNSLGSQQAAKCLMIPNVLTFCQLAQKGPTAFLNSKATNEILLCNIFECLASQPFSSTHKLSFRKGT